MRRDGARPGKYELTATSIETFDVDQIPSPDSNAVTVIVGTTDAALLGYPESGTVWNSLAPQLSGTGPALGEVEVEILFGEGSATYCIVPEVPASGAWSCTPSAVPSWTWGVIELRAYGLDVTGNPTADDQIVGEFVPPVPTTEIVLGPASASLTAQGTPDTWFQTRVYEAILNGEGSSFTLRETCDSAGDPPVIECSVSGLTPGIWNFYTNQDFEETYLETIDEYVLIPSTPTGFAATVLADRSVRFSGQGEPGFRAIVRDTAQNSVCSTIITGGGAWQCTVTRPVGTASYRSLQQSIGFDTLDYSVSSDRSLDGFSALTSSISVTVPPPPAPAPPAPPALSTVTPGLVQLSPLPTSATAGAQLEIVGSTDCIDPVVCDVDVDIFSTPQRLGSTVTEPAGTFSLVVTVPEELEPGEHTIVVTVTPRGGVASSVSQPITIAAPAAVDPVQAIPRAHRSRQG